MRNLFWFRRDLRIEDNIGLYHCLKESTEVIPLFIIESDFINSVDTGSAKVYFLFDSLKKLSESFRKINSKLIIRFGDPVTEISNLMIENDINTLYFNRTYENNEIIRDEKVSHAVEKVSKNIKTYKDQIIFETHELEINKDFSEYVNAWNKKIKFGNYKTIEISARDKNKFIDQDNKILSLASLNPSEYNVSLNAKYRIAGEEQALKVINKIFEEKSFNYENNFIDFYSFISPYLHFGNISVRTIIAKIKSVYRYMKNKEKYELSEILKNIIKKEYYTKISSQKFINSENKKNTFSNFNIDSKYKKFFIWCNGETGYPIIDASMRQLNQEGVIHSLLKEISASFLVNDLKIDKEWGKRYFMHKFIDSDYSFENEYWENLNSSFNIIEKSKEFDPKSIFLKKYLPELNVLPDKYIHEPYKMPFNFQKKIKFVIGEDYPLPVVKIKDNIEKIDIVINETEDKK